MVGSSATSRFGGTSHPKATTAERDGDVGGELDQLLPAQGAVVLAGGEGRNHRARLGHEVGLRQAAQVDGVGGELPLSGNAGFVASHHFGWTLGVL